MGQIISGFAGIGKTNYALNNPTKAIDLESSNFKWIYDDEDVKNLGEGRKGISDKKLHPNWPFNYIEAIKENLEKYDYVFICQDMDVRAFLRAEELEYTVVFPSIEAKEEYLQRYRDRGNGENFINLFENRYEQFVQDLEIKEENKIILSPGQYLSDVLK